MEERMFIVFEQSERLQKLVDDLSSWGMPFCQAVWPESGALSSTASQAQGPYRLVPLQVSTLLTDLGQLRRDYPSSALVIYQSAQTLSSEQRCLLLLAGADVCFDEQTDRMELLAGIQALRRRGSALRLCQRSGPVGTGPDERSARTADPESGWTLIQDGWCLVSPRRVSIALTAGEREIVQLLFQHRPKPVSRQALTHQRPGRLDKSSSRPVDMMIGRIKRKIARYGEVSPVYTVRGVGYAFIS